MKEDELLRQIEEKCKEIGIIANTFNDDLYGAEKIADGIRKMIDEYRENKDTIS